jgi:hypothetical protein
LQIAADTTLTDTQRASKEQILSFDGAQLSVKAPPEISSEINYSKKLNYL